MFFDFPLSLLNSLYSCCSSLSLWASAPPASGPQSSSAPSTAGPLRWPAARHASLPLFSLSLVRDGDGDCPGSAANRARAAPSRPGGGGVWGHGDGHEDAVACPSLPCGEGPGRRWGDPPDRRRAEPGREKGGGTETTGGEGRERTRKMVRRDGIAKDGEKTKPPPTVLSVGGGYFFFGPPPPGSRPVPRTPTTGHGGVLLWPDREEASCAGWGSFLCDRGSFPCWVGSFQMVQKIGQVWER